MLTTLDFTTGDNDAIIIMLLHTGKFDLKSMIETQCTSLLILAAKGTSFPSSIFLIRFFHWRLLTKHFV